MPLRLVLLNQYIREIGAMFLIDATDPTPLYGPELAKLS
jgi:hypothetical protein